MINPNSYGTLISGIGSRSTLDWKNTGSVDITLSVGGLRPLQIYKSEEDELIPILPVSADYEGKGTWEITARDHNEIYSGELVIPIGPPLDLTETVRDGLGLN